MNNGYWVRVMPKRISFGGIRAVYIWPNTQCKQLLAINHGNG